MSGTAERTYGLGRLPAVDARDRDHPMQLAAAPTEALPLYHYWYDGAYYGDQGNTPMCVEYGWGHFCTDSPIVDTATGPPWQTGEVYHAAQLVDEFPGEDYEGTSVRAGAKVLQARGLIGEYRWAFDVDTVLRCVLTTSPVVMGTNWYESMFNPDPVTGRVSIGGAMAGGHCWVVNGYNDRTGWARCKNSWSFQWGHRGHFFIHRTDLARLIAEDGEACMAVERPRP